MKKIIAVLVIFVCVGTALSAQISMSAGAGALFGGQFSSYRPGEDGKKAPYKDNWKYSNSRYINFGGFAFFDATYVEADVGLRFGTVKNSSYSSNASDDQKKGSTATFLTLGLFGKFPIDLGGLTVFPLAGIQYDFLLASKYYKDGDKEKVDVDSKVREGANRFWIKVGGGADINITPQIYVRPSFLYGIGFKNKGDKDTIDRWEKDEGDKVLKNIFTHGFDIRVAVGYRF